MANPMLTAMALADVLIAQASSAPPGYAYVRAPVDVSGPLTLSVEFACDDPEAVCPVR